MARPLALRTFLRAADDWKDISVTARCMRWRQEDRRCNASTGIVRVVFSS